MGHHGQRLFLTWARPLAPLLVLLAYGGVWLFERTDELLQIMALLALSVVLGTGYALASRRATADRVLRVALPLDTLLIAGMTIALERPDVLAIAYFWSVALAALFLNPRATVANTALAALCALVVPLAAPFDRSVAVVATDVIVLLLIGGLLALFSRHALEAQDALARERALDARALAITQNVRSTLDLDEVLNAMLREIGTTLQAERAILRLRGGPEERSKLFHWEARGVAPYTAEEPPAFIRAVFEDAQARVWTRGDDVPDDVRDFFDAIGAVTIVVYPMMWQGSVVAVMGCTDSRPRNWAADVLPLFSRLSPQLGAALAQAELFEQQQQTLDEFRQLSRLREDLVANVSHELRTPLTSTLGFLQTLVRRYDNLNDERRRDFVELALREAERLGKLVDDLLDLARIERGAVVLTRGPVDVRGVLDRAAVGLDLEGRDLHFDLDGELVVHGDPDRLLQVFSNLLSNAVYHGGGAITVRGALHARTVEVTIEDGGEGVPTDRVAQLFVPFSHWGARGDSTGLGLAIARSIVHAHGGTLFYRPAHDGIEHAFVLTLPRADVTPPPIPEKE